MLRFDQPWLLVLLLLIPLYLWLKLRLEKKGKSTLPFTRLALLKKLGGENRWWRWLYPGLRALIMFCLIVAIAQPKWGQGRRDLSMKGVDIVLAVDISGSMLIPDFASGDRLTAAVGVAREFINKRPNDRFALVAFSEYALTQSPLTFDHDAILDQLSLLEVNQEASFTAIGLGLAKSVARLKDSSAKSKIIVLITDGMNNTGEIDPLSAARMAKEFNIKVYPIGVGSNGLMDFDDFDPRLSPFFGQYRAELDMETLNQVAAITGTGKAARAGNEEQFREIMDNIDRMERTPFNTRIMYIWGDKFMPFLWLAFVLLIIELLMRLLFMPILPE